MCKEYLSFINLNNEINYNDCIICHTYPLPILNEYVKADIKLIIRNDKVI